MKLSSPLMFVLAVALCACGERPASVPTVQSPSATPKQADGSALDQVTPAAGVCNHEKAAWAVGQTGSDDILERARLDAGAEVARFLRPGQAVTMEYNERRLNLDLDANNVVAAARCG